MSDRAPVPVIPGQPNLTAPGLDLDVAKPKITPEEERLKLLIPVVRDYLMDYPETNHLLEAEEFSDRRLVMCIILALDSFNNLVMPRTNFKLTEFPSLELLLEGAALEAIKQAIFRWIRNSFQYNDAGVQVSVEERGAEYERTLSRLREDFTRRAQLLKEHMNLEQCYGSFSSEYLNLYGRRWYHTVP